MKKTLAAVALLLGLLAAAAYVLLDTGPGLRWAVGQILARTGAPVEIGAVAGRLLGPVSLSNVRYAAPGKGAQVRIKTIRLDWRPVDLFHGVLHVTRLGLAGVDYHAGGSSPPATKETAPTPKIALPLVVRVDSLRLESVSIDTGSGRPFPVESVSLSASLTGRVLTLGGLEITAARYRIDHGRAHVDLEPRLPITGSLSWSARPGDMPAVQGDLEVEGALRETLKPVIDLEQPFTAHAEGTVTHLLDGPTWTLHASVPKAVSLAEIRKNWPAVSIRGVVQSQGDMRQAHLQPSVTLAFRGKSVNVAGDASVTKEALVIDQAHLTRPGGSGSGVQLSGRLGLGATLPFKLQGGWTSLHGPDEAPWSSRTGQFHASGDRSGVVANLSGVITPPDQSEESPIDVDLEANHLQGEPAVTGNVRLPFFAWGSLRATGLAADLSYQAGEGAPSKLSVKAAALQLGKRQASGVSVRASGTRERHELSVDGVLDGWPVALAVTGSYSDEHWMGRLRSLDVTSKSEALPGRWQLEKPTDLAWQPSGAKVGRLCLAHEEAKLCAGGHFSGGKDWELAAEATQFPLRWLAPGAPDSLEIEGVVNAQASLGDRGKGLEGKAAAKVAHATVAWTSEQPVTTHYRDVELDGTLDPSSLHAALHASVDEGGTIQGELTTAEPLAPDGEIHGSLKADLPSLRLVQAAFPDLGVTGGSARLQFQVAGTRSAPRLTGTGRIRQAKVDVSALGVRLESLDLDVRSSSDRSLHLAAQAKSGSGTLKAEGDFRLPETGGWRGDFTVTGNQADLLRLPQAVVTGNPDLEVSISRAGGKVKGRIQVTKAELTPEAARPKVTLSSDIVVVGAKAPSQPANNPMDWDLDITVNLGDHTGFKGYGLSGRLTGSLALNAPAHRTTRANGSIRILKGQYSFYGRTFDITNGALLYAGGPIDNPGVDVQVGRKVGDVSVTLAATGPLVDPNISLSSTPAMSDTDKMSYLLLGRPASQASGAEATVLLKAAASLIPGGSHGATGFLQSTLGLDTLEVQTESTQAQSQGEGTSVVLGKYLSPRLYVSYAAGFQQAVDVFRVRYELARHWLLQAESSARESGGDLMFKW
ncbi:MAG: translocation/assembly module TamB domain-containing protein [Arenicellales bacterium]